MLAWLASWQQGIGGSGMTMVEQKVLEILEDLVEHPWLEVAFLIDSAGQLLASAGDSPAFSPTGVFGQPHELAGSEPPGTCLYLSTLTQKHHLGILFSSEVTIDQVRGQVKLRKEELVSLLER
ncbi:MAG: hypothetical protein JW797_09385 [Bradymonadales bacterium]|nr:hypothetical protein [Bradymonadales bacterium]